MGNVTFVGAVLQVTAHTNFTDCKEVNVAPPQKKHEFVSNIYSSEEISTYSIKVDQQRSARTELKSPWYLLCKILYENIRTLWRILETMNSVLSGGLPSSGHINHMCRGRFCVTDAESMSGQAPACYKHILDIHSKSAIWETLLGRQQPWNYKSNQLQRRYNSLPSQENSIHCLWCCNQDCTLTEDLRPLLTGVLWPYIYAIIGNFPEKESGILGHDTNFKVLL